jgi:diguanylate cyclase (GGDEF)-like protein
VSILILLFLTTALSAVMLMVLRSLPRSSGRRTPEVLAWSRANGLAIAALPLYAGRGAIPDLLSIELANLLFLCAPVMMYVGFRRHLDQDVPVRLLGGVVAASTILLAVFHYAADVAAARIALSSVAHGVIYAAIARTLGGRARRAAAAYPRRFARWVALLLALAHAVRACAYAIQYDADVALFDPSLLNLACFALGTLALPALTLGAVMMANADTIARATWAAEHDHLTGAWSRRAFFRLAERERERVARGGGELSLLVFDVDHFKAINDTHGHPVGDQVLADIVLRAATVIRGIDACARLGGEEFAVLLPQTGGEQARHVAERLRHTLEQACVRAAHGLVRYTVSVGIASLLPEESIAALLARADAALYQAKAAGRNRVVDARVVDARVGDARMVDAAERVA